MPTLDTLALDGKFRAFIFGYYKSGKTAGALTMPRPNVLDFDSGVVVGLAGWHREKFGVDPKSILFEQFGSETVTKEGVPKTYNVVDNAARYFDACMSSKTVMWKSSDGKEYPVNVDMFDTWVIDSATTLGEAAFNKGMILLGNKDFTGGKVLSHTHANAVKMGMVVKKVQDYGAERSILEQFIDMILKSGKHVIVLGHAKDEYEGEGDDAKVVGIVPMLTGQSVQRVPLKFNEVYWCEMRKEGLNTEAYLFTSADSKIKRGSRLGLSDKTPWNWPSVRDDLKSKGYSFSPDGAESPSITAATAAKE